MIKTDARYTVYIDKAYRNYVNKCNEDKWMKEIVLNLPSPNKSYGLFSQEEFINKCKTDSEFSEKWGLKIEERELSLEERKKIYESGYTDGTEIYNDYWLESKLTTRNIPTKLITVLYTEKIESYV
jgi:hypothetical protein